MDVSMPGSPTEPEQQPAGTPHLKRGAIGYISNVVIGVASTAPAYSLAATVGYFVLINGVGVHSPAIVLVSFFPLFFIATAYNAMNRVDPDCGTTFSWTTRAMGANWGWVIGWTIIFSDIVVNANQAQIAGDYGFQLFGLHGAANNKWDVIILGVLFIILLTWICWRGIELSARTQQLLLGFEMTTLVIFSIVALIKVYVGSHAASSHVSIEWFNPFGMSFGALVDGLLLGVFLYWGWDTGVSVNEESENSADGPGKSAVTATFILIGIYLLVTVAAQAYGGTKYLAKNPSDIFAGGLSVGVLGVFHILLTISVLTSATAATQTTILPAARSALSMARRGAIPEGFAEIHERNLIPGKATVWAGVLSIIWYIVISIGSSNVLGDCVAGLGFLVCIYYGFTGFTCAIYYRRELRRSAKNFFTLGFIPTLGGAILMAILVYGVIYYGHAANDDSPPLLHLGVPDWILIIGVVGGIALMLWRRAVAPRFFHEKRYVAGEKFEIVTAEADFDPASSML